MSVAISRITKFVIFSVSFLLSSCVYYDYPTPHIEGTLTSAGEPLAGVVISLTEFHRQTATVQTDSNGHFSMAPKRDWHLFIPVGPQDSQICWTLTTIDANGRKLSIYSEQRFGGAFSGYSRNDRANLICDLSIADDKIRSKQDNLFCKLASSPR